MAFSLESVSDYVDAVRVILLDLTEPFRYEDASLVLALNLALQEGRRIRPDLFVCKYTLDVPQYEAVSGELVPIEGQFRLGFLYGMAAQTLLQDEEDVQDERSNTYMNMFQSILTGVRVAPIRGGTPGVNQGTR